VQTFHDAYFTSPTFSNYNTPKEFIPLKKKYQDYIDQETIHEKETLMDPDYCHIVCKRNKVIFDIIHPSTIDHFELDMRNDLCQGLSI
jgi:hypothetical protein